MTEPAERNISIRLVAIRTSSRNTKKRSPGSLACLQHLCTPNIDSREDKGDMVLAVRTSNAAQPSPHSAAK
ncbi:hypothetical protein OUZ56_021242 [Daphnia magna]|uniref:Uncharacterized protein n=1 Tax=Daphnia magna TaxID=35525 RepID=A0ABQ9ZHH6_9CRUS|nr:hypothetical protein OUZ56_021242 [Daphnia magna]